MKKRKIKLPKGFRLYGGFVALLFISLLWSQDIWISFELWLQFLAGGLFWLGSYNLRIELRQRLDKLIVILGLVFGGMFVHYYYFQDFKLGVWSLYLDYTFYRNHNNIGELWAVVLMVAGSNPRLKL